MKPDHIRRLLVCAVALFTIASSSELKAQEFTNHFYGVVSGVFTWNQARTDAEWRGGHLATITSQAEADYIQSLGILGSIPGEAFWLGASDEVQEGTWTWVTGEPFNFALWAPGEPNNLTGCEDYLATTDIVNAAVWNDWGCASSTMNHYLLEIDCPCSIPRKASATATVVNGFVVGVTITDPGCGYTDPPAVVVRGGGGSDARATTVVSNRVVVAINVVSAGSGYTNAPTILIASPPFLPTLSIAFSKVKVIQNVVLGRNYILQSSTDLVSWAATGPPFTADSESIVTEFDVDVTGRFFRILEVP
jgi:hypothetical protein